ncbi:hypothetical protein [Dokdonella sp.]|uniref:hypothetical protein n=1 Tax=Dokdonella sp. TaxID=2291710 RepID=UPI003526E055
MSPSRWVNFCPQELILHHPSGVQRGGVWRVRIGESRQAYRQAADGFRLPSSFKEIMLQA